MIELFTTIAGKIGVSASLLLAICTQESGLRSVNNWNDPHGGSHGKCQINGHTAREILPYVDRLALQQDSVNILIAAMYVKRLQDKYLYDADIISAYNMGTPKYKNGQLVNQVYIDKVLVLMDTKYKEIN